jgi:hypothetical protein
MPFKQNLTSVGTSATLLCTLGGVAPDNGGVMVQNLGTVAVFIGGSNVTTSGATQGISVAANALVTVPTSGASSSLSLYGISGTAGQNVVTLFPG